MIAIDAATRHSSAMSDSRNAVEPDSDTSGVPIWAVAAESFRSWRGGDRGAIDRLVAAMNPVLWQVVRAYRLDEMATKDVIQETWMTLLNKHESIADPQAVAAWLTTTARREAWRVANRKRRDVTVEDYQLDAAMESAPSAEVVALSGIDDSLLWRSVLTLSERCQRLLRIIAFDERPDYHRIAADLEMPTGSIGPTRSRCLDKLRHALSLGGAS
jgi:RNA polymerase sigma factor (sigma-70 family)